MMWFAYSLLSLLVPHGFIDRTASLNIIHQWIPSQTHRGIFLTSAANKIASAEGLLQNDTAHGIIDSDLNLYIVSLDEANVTTLETIFWRNPVAQRLMDFRNLRFWHDVHFPHARLDGNGICDENDRQCWYWSLFVD